MQVHNLTRFNKLVVLIVYSLNTLKGKIIKGYIYTYIYGPFMDHCLVIQFPRREVLKICKRWSTISALSKPTNPDPHSLQKDVVWENEGNLRVRERWVLRKDCTI